ncbi:MAG TPA: hypothetical protein VHQ21_04125 [Rhodanobacteraceae bacterium]|jgi:hypothetical protein|nr:hypothetical protein [Rhodanobacteraceae bacterium]
MIFARAFCPADLMALALQPQQRQIFLATTDYAEALCSAGPAYTAFAPTGELVGCLGLMHQWDGYARAYAFLGENAGKHMLSLTRQIRAWLDQRPERRIDAAVDNGFPQAYKWCRALGFKREGPLEKYFGDRDCTQYVRIR